MDAAFRNELLAELVARLKEKVLGAKDAPNEMAVVYKIQAETNLGERTLKRLFGLEKAPPDYFPYHGTRDILAKFLGFADWADFVAKNKNPIHPAPTTVEPSQRVSLPPLPHDIHFPNKPFRNLDWFRREDARVFFGREMAIMEMIHYIESPHGDRVILLYGQSGVGKSSFLHAGLLPRLESRWEVTIQNDGTDRNGHTFGSPEWTQTIDRITRPTLYVLDQLETIFLGDGNNTLFGATHFRLGIQHIVNHCHTVKLILSFRKEYFADFDAILGQLNISFKRYYLKPLSPDEIELSVTGITLDKEAFQKYELVIEPQVPEKILEIVAIDRQSHIAPTLQIILTKLWEQATEAGKWPPVFSDALLLANIQPQTHFLGHFLDENISAIESRFPSVGRSGLILDLLSYFVSSLSTAQERTTKQIREEYYHIPQILEFAEALRNRYLLSDTANHEKGVFRLAHDALGPLVQLRVNTSFLPGQRARRLLESRINPDWREKMDKEFLPSWDIVSLDLIEEGKYGMRGWKELEKESIHRSQEALKAVETHSKRNRLARTVVFAGLIAILAITTWLVQNFNQQAKRERSEKLMAELKTMVEDHAPDLGHLQALGLEIQDLGFHRQELEEELSKLVKDYVLYYSGKFLETLLPVLKVNEGSDTLRKPYYGELAYLFMYGRKFKNGVESLLFLGNPNREINPNDSCQYIRDGITNLCGQDYLTSLDRKYHPCFLRVPHPTKEELGADTSFTKINQDYFLAQTEITYYQAMAWINMFGQEIHDSKLNSFIGSYSGGCKIVKEVKGTHPFMCNRYLANDYCTFWGYQLPQIREWEFAALGGNVQSKNNFSGGNNLDEVACYSIGFRSEPTFCEVASKKPNELGFFDMTGNLSEWLMENIIYPNGKVSLGYAKGGNFNSIVGDYLLRVRSPSSPLGMNRWESVGFRPKAISLPDHCALLSSE